MLFGNTAKSAAIVLFVFFLGMAIGNSWGGRLASRVSSPFKAYGLVELGIAITASPVLLVTSLYLHLQPMLLVGDTASWVMDMAKVLVALVFMLPASIFIGATFPLLGSVLITQRALLGRDAGRLYAINTFGAVGGVVLAGFLLPPFLGNFNTYVLALMTNCVLGGLVLAWWRSNPHLSVQSVETNQPPIPDTRNDEGGVSLLPQRVLLGIAFGSGLGTIAIEVLWTRMFALVFQNSVYSFSAIVLIFLVGLALGALLISGAQKFLRHAVAVLGVSLGITSLCVVITPLLFAYMTGFAYFEYGVGWPLYIFKVVALVAGIIIVPVLSAGFSLPLLWRLYEQFHRPVGTTLGGVNLWNLLGALSGGIIAGFVLIPTMGLWKAIVAVGLLFLLLSQLALFYGKSRGLRTCAVTMGLSFSLVIVFLANPMQYSSQRIKPGERLLYLDEGREAAISVVRDAQNVIWLKSNNTYNLGATVAVRGEKRLGHLPLLLHPEPKDVAFVGVATGISMSAGIDHDLDSLVGIEILPGVLDALPYFKEENADLLVNDNVKAVVDDGRVYLRTTNRKYDAIVSDLFVPWHAGTGNLYTLEHYQASAKRLNPNGLYCQWLPLYQLSDREFGIIAATMAKAFPHVSVWRGDYSAKAPIIGLVGSNDPIILDMDTITPRIARLQEKIQPKDPLLRSANGFLTMYGGDLSTVQSWLEQFPLNTDNLPIIEFEAPKSQTRKQMYKGTSLAMLYTRLAQASSSGTAVQVKTAAFDSSTPLSAQPGNLLFRAVVQGIENDINGQLLTIREATQIMKGSDYLDVLNIVLRSMDSHGIRGADVASRRGNDRS